MPNRKPTLKSAKKVKFGVIIVSHNNINTLKKLLASLESEVASDDFVVVVDNHKAHASIPIANEFKCVNKSITSENDGFAAACNVGFELLPVYCTHVLLLNPDTILQKGTLKNLKSKTTRWSVCMGLLTMNDDKVNSAGNIVHISGLSWCNGFGDNVKKHTQSKEVFIATGAAMSVDRNVWQSINGIYDEYFLYYEDTDFSTQIIMTGGKIGLEPSAFIYHDYDYSKSDTKWFYLERNRYIYIIRCWPMPVILLLLPYLICIELGLWLVSIIERRFVLKLRSTLSLVKALPKSWASRKNVQKNRVISSYDFLQHLEPQVLTLQLGNPNNFKLLNAFSKMYYLFVKNILKLTAKKVQ